MTCSFKSSRALLVAALVALFFNGAFAHTYLSSVFSNGQALEEGDCVRPHPSTAYDFPIPLVTSPEMTCGWASGKNNERANRRCPVEAGSMFGLQWYHQRPGPQDQIVDPTHAGPLMVYLAKSDSGAGNVWFKIYEDGYSNGQWAVEKMIANRGRVDFRIPADIAPGNYLLRGEILAHHESYRINGVQPYVGCVEITISGNGNVNPTGVAFPGFYKNTDPGMLFDRYGQSPSTYIIPGPAVYSSSSSSSSSGSNNNNNNNNNPTTAPSKPEATTRPTNAPSTSAPVANSIKIGLNGANQWYFGVVVNGGGETTVKVEMKDNGSVKNWVAMTDKSYAYAYSANPVLVLPVSIRLTSSSGKVVVLENIFNSFSGSVDTGKTYASSSNVPATSAPVTSAPVTSAPVTSAPVTSAPVTSAPVTNAPTKAPSTSGNNGNNGNSAKVTIFGSASEWWFALSVSGAFDVAKVEIKDSGAVSSFKSMDANNWGGSSPVYTFSAQGNPLSTPITVKITNQSGKSVTTIINKISGNAVFNADGSL